MYSTSENFSNKMPTGSTLVNVHQRNMVIEKSLLIPRENEFLSLSFSSTCCLLVEKHQRCLRYRRSSCLLRRDELKTVVGSLTKGIEAWAGPHNGSGNCSLRLFPFPHTSKKGGYLEHFPDRAVVRMK